MPSLQSILIPAVMSFAVAANANFNLGGNLLGKRLVTNCPNYWTPVNYNGQGRCCHGSLSVEEDNEPYCCVMNYHDYDWNDRPRFSDCFPFCSGTDDGGPSVTWSNEPSCITRVPFSASDYSNIVSSAASSGDSSTSTTNEPASNEASPTSTSSSNSNNSDDSDDSDDSNDMNPTSSDWSGDSTRNAAPVATAGSVLGGAAMAAVLFAL
ncbi:hypothetical protein N7456_009360 [Penicillium angulare]|uniref:Uncharacterized protein n=1 Tax=Penicillium angulare TaxID=116970 RepID=A0A9W9F4Q7_9EURO|nr:hypothetical protein N7456_009360 [Penicillium angulare]